MQMGDSQNDGSDERYCIEWTNAEHLSADGGFGEQWHALTRERLSSVESTVKNVEQTTERIETTVEDIADEVQTVEDESLSREQFNRHYADEIEQNARITHILKWLATVVAIVASVLGVILKLGGVI